MKRQFLAKLSSNQQSWANIRARKRGLWLRFNIRQEILSINIILAGLVVTILLASATPLMAIASTISESYSGNNDFKIGSIVSLKRDDSKGVELSNVNNSDYLLGVVTEADEALLSFNTAGDRVNVATIGEVLTYVSNINGDIKTGDFVVPSQVAGVGMRAEDNSGKVLGVASADFNDTSPFAQSFKLNDLNKEAAIGPIPVRLLARDVSATNNVKDKSALETLGEKLVGKPVSLIQVIVAVALFMMTLGVSGVILYGAIRGSFRSIGRNPLASKSVFSNLFQVIILSVSVMVIGLFAGYLILLL